MRRILSVLVAVCLVLSFFTLVPSAKADISGDYMYTLDGSGNATITRYYGLAAIVNIPSALDGHTVTSIGNQAFMLRTSLTSVTIPSSVTSIGNGAFMGCSLLTSVTIPSGVTRIGDEAFLGCSALSSFVVDPGSSSYSSSADGVLFNKTRTVLVEYPGGKSGAYEIPSGVTSIGYGAFEACTSLAGVTIPSSVTSIGDLAFFGCTSLASVAIGIGVTSIGTQAFYWCSSLWSITLPSSVTSIGNEAFYSCWHMTPADFLGNAPTTMGTDVFYNCGAGFTVRYVNGTTGWTNSWYSCPTTPFASYITPSAGPGGSITPSSRALVELHQGETFTISPDANCSVADVFVDGASVGAVTSYTFSDVTAAHTITASFAAGTTSGDYTYTLDSSGNATITKYTGSSVNLIIPGTLDGHPVTSIGKWVFDGFGSLTSVTIPNGVTSISDGAFFCCDHLTSVIIPSSVLSIGDDVFEGCCLLTSVTIPSRVTSIGDFAFRSCSNLNAAYFLGNAPTTVGVSPFDNCVANPTFTVRYANGTTGWTNPWYTYPTVPFASYITVSVGSGGTISPSSRVLVNVDDSQEFTISPDANNRVADVLVDGVSVGAVGSYTLSGVAVHTISATFTANRYTLTTSARAGGTIAPGTPQTILQGGSQSFTITPDHGYMIERLTDNGTIIADASHQLSYTLSLTNITSSHTITVAFMPIPDVAPPVLTLPDFRTMSGVTGWSGGTVETFTTGSSPFPLTFAVEDGSGSAQWTITVNGAVIAGGFGTGSPSTSLPLAEGRNDVVVSASDAAGNRTSQQLVITCDTTGPALTIDPAMPASVTNPALTITGSVKDAGSGLRSLTINGTAVTPYLDGSFREQLTLAGGDNTITFEAEDHVGHVTSRTFTVAYRRPSSTPSSLYVVLTVGKSTMEVNGLAHALDAAPFIKNGRTLLPIRALIETLGGNVTWNAATRAATVTLGSRTVVLTIGSKTALVNGKPVTLDVAPMIVRGRSFLPLRAVAENIGLDLAWDAASQTVSLTYWP